MNIVCRKLLATYFSASLIGLFFGYLFAMDFNIERAMNFYAMTLIVLFYGGIIILLYGNATSFLSEYINKRWLQNRTITFVIIHLLFGAVFGVFFNEVQIVLLGMAGAFLYALTDRVLYKRKEGSKVAFIFALSPPAVYLLGIVVLWIAY